MSKTLLFSVIVPTYHRNELLAKCLDCLAPDVQTLTSDRYEVIITDDGSRTTAKSIIQEQYPWAKWFSGPQRGPAANRNNGARHAQGEWLVFTDDDCLPNTKWLEAYAEAVASQPDCFVFEGRTYVDHPRKSLAEKSPVNETGGYLWSCNFAVKKKLFVSLRGFDERFRYAAMEDVELRLRLTQSENYFLFVKGASVCHPWRESRGWQELKRHQQSVLIYLSIHPEQIKYINSQYYFYSLARSFIKLTIPGVFKFKGCGIKNALLEHFSSLQMVFILWLKQYRNGQID
ncbi:MAG TPA: glycosyltransferase [Phormidium sp.]